MITKPKDECRPHAPPCNKASSCTGGEPASAGDFGASQPCDPIRPRAFERALADSQQALKAAQALLDADERRHALELAARDARYFAERVVARLRFRQPIEPADTVIVVFGILGT